MSVKLMRIVWKMVMPQTEKFVLLALADHADDGGECWPSVSTLMQDCCLSKSSVLRALTALTKAGVIEPVKASGRASVYQLKLIHNRCHRDTGTTVTPVSQSNMGGVTQTPVFNTRKEPSVNHQLTTSKPPYVCTEPAKTPAPCRSRSGDKAQSAKKIRLDETTWRFEGITGEQLKRWREAYPAADVELELRRAAAWIEANPRNRKTNSARYLANWLSRAQDRAPRSALVPVDRMPAYMDVSKQDYGNQTVIPL